MTDPSLAVSSTSLDELLKDQTDQSISTPQNHQPQHSTSRHTEAVSPTVNMEGSLRIVVDRQENKDYIGPSNIDHVSEYLTKGRLNKRRKSQQDRNMALDLFMRYRDKSCLQIE